MLQHSIQINTSWSYLGMGLHLSSPLPPSKPLALQASRAHTSTSPHLNLLALNLLALTSPATPPQIPRWRTPTGLASSVWAWPRLQRLLAGPRLSSLKLMLRMAR